MILTEFYKRHNKAPEEDLSKGGVGVVGVGSKLLDQLFSVQNGSLPPELEKAIEEFTKMMRTRNAKLNDLQVDLLLESVFFFFFFFFFLLVVVFFLRLFAGQVQGTVGESSRCCQ